MYLWRAVDQDGDLIDVLVQKRKDKKAAKRFFRRMLKHQGEAPNRITTEPPRVDRRLNPLRGLAYYEETTYLFPGSPGTRRSFSFQQRT